MRPARFILSVSLLFKELQKVQDVNLWEKYGAR